MDGILSNGCLIIIPGPKRETTTVTRDPYPQPDPDPQPYPQPAFILTIAVAVTISASIFVSTFRRKNPVPKPFSFPTCTIQTRRLRGSLTPNIISDPTCIDINPIRREVDRFWHRLRTVELLRGSPIGEDYFRCLEDFKGCITDLRNLLDREVPDPNINIVNAMDIDDTYEHLKLREQLQGILDNLEKFNDVVDKFSPIDYFENLANQIMGTILMKPTIKIDDLFNAVGACAECSVDYDMQYSGGYQILEILKFVENDLLIETARLNENARRNENAHLIEIEAFPGILIENNTTTLAVPEVNDLTNLQRIAIRTMQLSLRGDNIVVASVERAVQLCIACNVHDCHYRGGRQILRILEEVQNDALPHTEIINGLENTENTGFFGYNLMQHEVTDKWIDRMERAKERERNFQLARNEAYTAAYQHAENHAPSNQLSVSRARTEILLKMKTAKKMDLGLRDSLVFNILFLFSLVLYYNLIFPGHLKTLDLASLLQEYLFPSISTAKSSGYLNTYYSIYGNSGLLMNFSSIAKKFVVLVIIVSSILSLWVFKLVPSTMIGYIICAFVFPVPIYNFVSKSWLFSILLCLQLFVYQLIYKFDRLKIVWRLTVIRSTIDYRPIVLYILYPLFTIFLVYLLGRHYAVYQRSSIVYDRTRLRLDFKHEASSVFDEFSTIVRNMLN